jgi:hypothetical protein
MSKNKFQALQLEAKFLVIFGHFWSFLDKEKL